MRSPTLEEIERVFAERWSQLPAETDRLRPSLQAVRDLIVVGASRARARAGIADRKRRRTARRHRQIASTAEVTVLRRVARAGKIKVDRLMARDHSRTASRWRFRAMWVLYRVLDRSQEEVAELLERRDHSCVHRGVGIVDREIERDPRLGVRLRRLAA